MGGAHQFQWVDALDEAVRLIRIRLPADIVIQRDERVIDFTAHGQLRHTKVGTLAPHDHSTSQTYPEAVDAHTWCVRKIAVEPKDHRCLNR
jgi:hypothetical protein